MKTCKRKPLTLVNTESTTIPAFAALEVVSQSNSRVSVRRPTIDSATVVVFNGGNPIYGDKEGTGTHGWPTRILYNDADGDPLTGDDYGTEAGSYALKAGNFGLKAIAGAMDGPTALFMPATVCNDGDEPPDNPIVCGCEICCTLDATLSVNDGSDGWTVPLDVELTCGGSIEFEFAYSCLNDEVEDDSYYVVYTATFAEKDSFGSPEPYDNGVTSGTIEHKTVIWSSANFVINGETYKLHYWRTETATHQTSPTVSESTFCSEGWLLQILIPSDGIDPRGDHWDLVDSYWNGGSNVYGYWGAATLTAPSIFDVTITDPGCDEGYSYNGGDAGLSYGCATYPPPTSTFGGREDNSFSRCPVSLWSESWHSSFLSPTCEQRIPCVRVGIFDRCNDRLSCALETVLSSGITTTLDWQVEGCHSSSGSHEKTGAECSEFWMFNAGTAGLGWEGAGTEFDGDDPSGAGTEFAAFCDAEEVVWINTGTRYGRIEAALLCYTPEEGDPYIAAYARLDYNCYENLPPNTLCNGTYYGYKTRDLAITMADGEIIVSFTGLTPFSSSTGTPDPCPCSTCVCECDPAPTLSLAWRIKLSEC